MGVSARAEAGTFAVSGGRSTAALGGLLAADAPGRSEPLCDMPQTAMVASTPKIAASTRIVRRRCIEESRQDHFDPRAGPAGASLAGVMDMTPAAT